MRPAVIPLKGRAKRRGKASNVNSFGKNLALWIIIGLLLVALFNLFQSSTTRTPQNSLAYSELINDVNKGLVKDVTIQGNTITSKFNDQPQLLDLCAERSAIWSAG